MHIPESVVRVAPELAEDADLSFKVKKIGYRLNFTNRAIAMTNVPDTVGKLVRQRTRWDRGLVRTYYRKHRDIMYFRRFSPANFIEMALEWVFFDWLCPALPAVLDHHVGVFYAPASVCPVCQFLGLCCAEFPYSVFRDFNIGTAQGRMAPALDGLPHASLPRLFALGTNLFLHYGVPAHRLRGSLPSSHRL